MFQPTPDEPIIDILRTRRSPRAFGDRAVSTETLRRLLLAARWAASSYNEQPWAFILATKDQPAEFDKILNCLVEGNRGWANAAPVLMLTAASQQFQKAGKPNRHSWHDLGAAVAQMTAQATSEGLAVHQMAGVLPDHARDVFGVPAGWDVVTGVAVGYPGDPATLSDELRAREMAPPQRKPLAEMAFVGGWGRPAF